MSSSSSGSSFSSSTTTPVETHENDLMNAISGIASDYANQLFDWAGQAYAQGSQITNQAVSNFFNTSSQMNGLSNQLTNQYNNLFAPENAQLVADANSYASPARMAVDMGMAGATQAQAGQRALENSEEALRSYGINPSDGKSQKLKMAGEIQNAANIAGAQNMQRNADIATGQRLRSEAVQVGAQLPAAISNVNNTAIQANTGAANAQDALINTGANAYQVPNHYLSTAMNLKMPFSQTTGSSHSQNQSQSEDPGRSGGGGGGSGGGGGGYGGGGGGSPSGYTGMDPNTAAMGSDGGLGHAPDAGGVDIPGSYWGDPSGNANTNDWDSSAANEGGGGWDYSLDPSSNGDSGLAGGGGYFAQGGPVPASASPSGGAITDDVPATMPNGAPAHLNANEFVIPNDVVQWKGQEFFQKLINDSRKLRGAAPAHPTSRPPVR